MIDTNYEQDTIIEDWDILVLEGEDSLYKEKISLMISMSIDRRFWAWSPDAPRRKPIFKNVTYLKILT